MTIINMNVHNSKTACRSSDGKGVFFTSDLHSSPDRIFSQEMVVSITLQRWLMMLTVAEKEGLICLICPCYPKARPHIGCQKCYSVAIHCPHAHWGNEPATYAGPS